MRDQRTDCGQASFHAKSPGCSAACVTGCIGGDLRSGNVRNGENDPVEGAALGGLGAFAGAIAGYSVRQKFDRGMPDFAVALLEDALAVGGGLIAVALSARAE